MASELHLGDSNWKLFKVVYPVDTPTDMSFLLRVSVTHRPALARSIFGRWKELSLRMKPPSLPIVQGISRPTKGIRNTFWHTGIQWKNENKGENPPSLETLQKKKGKINKRGKKYTQILNKNEFRTKAEEEKWKEMGEKKKNKTNRHGKQGEKKGKTGGTAELLNYQPIPLPSLRNKTIARQKTIKTTKRKAKAER